VGDFSRGFWGGAEKANGTHSSIGHVAAVVVAVVLRCDVGRAFFLGALHEPGASDFSERASGAHLSDASNEKRESASEECVTVRGDG
jgi:hypothetical protein